MHRRSWQRNGNFRRAIWHLYLSMMSSCPTAFKLEMDLWSKLFCDTRRDCIVNSNESKSNEVSNPMTSWHRQVTQEQVYYCVFLQTSEHGTDICRQHAFLGTSASIPRCGQPKKLYSSMSRGDFSYQDPSSRGVKHTCYRIPRSWSCSAAKVSQGTSTYLISYCFPLNASFMTIPHTRSAK